MTKQRLIMPKSKANTTLRDWFRCIFIFAKLAFFISYNHHIASLAWILAVVSEFTILPRFSIASCFCFFLVISLFVSMSLSLCSLSLSLSLSLWSALFCIPSIETFDGKRVLYSGFVLDCHFHNVAFVLSIISRMLALKVALLIEVRFANACKKYVDFIRNCNFPCFTLYAILPGYLCHVISFIADHRAHGNEKWYWMGETREYNFERIRTDNRRTIPACHTIERRPAQCGLPGCTNLDKYKTKMNCKRNSRSKCQHKNLKLGKIGEDE